MPSKCISPQGKIFSFFMVGALPLSPSIRQTPILDPLEKLFDGFCKMYQVQRVWKRSVADSGSGQVGSVRSQGSTLGAQPQGLCQKW